MKRILGSLLAAVSIATALTAISAAPASAMCGGGVVYNTGVQRFNIGTSYGPFTLWSGEKSTKYACDTNYVKLFSNQCGAWRPHASRYPWGSIRRGSIQYLGSKSVWDVRTWTC